MNKKIIQKKYILIKYYRKIEINELPVEWINYINNVYFIEQEEYNFIEFNNSWEYSKIFYNQITNLKLFNTTLNAYKVIKKPLLLNSINNILFFIFLKKLNVKLNCSFLKVIFNLLFNFEKILIIKTNTNHFNCLIELKDINKAIKFKKVFEEFIFKFGLDINIYFSKKKTIKLNKNDLKFNKDFNYDRFYFNKNLSIKNKFSFLNVYSILDYEKLFLQYTMINFKKINKKENSKLINNSNNYDINNFLNKYEKDYCILIEYKKESNFENFYYLLSMFFKKFKIVLNCENKFGYLWLFNSNDYQKFKISFLKYFNWYLNFKILDSKNELFNLLFINKKYPNKMRNMLSTNIKKNIKKFLLRKFYNKLLDKSKTFFYKNKKILNVSRILVLKIISPQTNKQYQKMLWGYNILFHINLCRNKLIKLIIFNNYDDIFEMITNNRNLFNFKSLNTELILSIKKKNLSYSNYYKNI